MGWRFLGLVAMLASAGSLAYASAGGAMRSQPLSGRVPGVASTAPHRLFSPAGHRYRIVVSPALDAGDAGWQSFLIYSGGGGGGGGGGYPTTTWPFFAGSEGFTIYGPAQAPTGDIVEYVLTGPNVTAVRVGKQTILTFSTSQLPAGDRAAVFFRRAALPAVILPAPTPPFLRRAVRVLPLDSAGHVIPTHLPPPPPIQAVRFWQAPSAVTPNIHEPPYHGPKHPLPGACELSQHGLPGLTPEWGHVIGRIRPVTDSQGEVFLACVDTEYYLHGWPLEVSVLVDAVQPGQTLGAIPGAGPVIGHPNMVNLGAGQFPGFLTARREGEAWLVVQGGASLNQRLRVLGALEIAKLALPH